MASLLERVAKGKDAGILGGAFKGALGTVRGAANLAGRQLNRLNPAVNAISGALGARGKTQGYQDLIGGDVLQTKSTGESIGFAAERIAEFLVPSSGIVKTGALASKGLQSLIGGSKLVRGATGLVARAGVEAATTGGIAAVQQGGFNRPAQTAALVAALFPAGGALYRGAKTALGKGTKNLGEDIIYSQLSPTRGIENDGFDIANLAKHGIQKGGLKQMLRESATKVHGYYDELTKELQAAAQKRGMNTLDEPVDMFGVLNRAREKLKINAANNSGDNAMIQRHIDNLFQDVQSWAGQGGMRTDFMTAQGAKQAWGRKGSWAHGAANNVEANAIEKVYNTAYLELMKEIEQKAAQHGSHRIQTLNRKIQELIPIQNAIIRKIPIEKRRAVLDFGDQVSFFGALLDPMFLSIMGAGKLSKSLRFGNFLMRAGDNLKNRVPRTGIGERFTGRPAPGFDIAEEIARQPKLLKDPGVIFAGGGRDASRTTVTGGPIPPGGGYAPVGGPPRIGGKGSSSTPSVIPLYGPGGIGGARYQGSQPFKGPGALSNFAKKKAKKKK